MKTIQIWRLHSQGCRVTKADGTLGGEAPESARKYCGPFIQANRAGFYLYSPVDVDITWHGSDDWSCTPGTAFWSDDELIQVNAMSAGEHSLHEMRAFLPRTKLFLPGVSNEPRHTAQLWTGCIFQTEPGWALWLRNPINRGYEAPFHIEEAILETEWLHQDIWLNLRFLVPDQKAILRRNGPPIAHLVPIPCSALEGWECVEKQFDPHEAGAREVFEWWRGYNMEKFCSSPSTAKDSEIYHRRKKVARRVL